MFVPCPLIAKVCPFAGIDEKGELRCGFITSANRFITIGKRKSSYIENHVEKLSDGDCRWKK